MQLSDISKRFGDTLALQTMSLEVRAGEMIALLGPSGCGKTTTLRCIAGFETPDTGQIRIGGRDLTRIPPDKRGLGMVFQNYSLFPHLSVGRNIGFGLRMAGVPAERIDAEVRRMLDMIRLPGHADRRISQLSGGQQQRIALARALITNPSVLLLDEPLGALDKNLREGMQFELRRLQRELGITSVLVTHDQEEALTMSDRVVVMDRGQILQVGPPREVYERPRTRFVAEFLGTANVFRARVVGQEGGGLRLALLMRSGGACEFHVSQAHPRGSEAVMLAVRPEKLSMGRASEHAICLQGVVREHVFRGSQHAYQVEISDLDCSFVVHELSSVHGGVECVPGQSVEVSFAPADVVLLEDEVEPAVVRPGKTT